MPIKGILTGILAGYFSGQFGIGGALISTPLLRLWLKTTPLIAVGTTLVPIIPGALVGAFNYARQGYVIKERLPSLVFGGLIGVVLGSLATLYVSGHWLMVMTAFLIFFLAWRFLLPTQSKFRSRLVSWLRVGILGGFFESFGLGLGSLAVGWGAGFFSGLLGVGGGFLLIPGLIFLLGAGIKEAFGTSLAVIACLVLPASLLHLLFGHVDLFIALYLTLGVIPGAYLGSKVAISLPPHWLAFFFGCLLLLTSLYFGYTEVKLLW
jgi:hypothetical protein